MNRRVQVDDLSADDMRRLVAEAVAHATGDLRKEVEGLRSAMMLRRGVITHTEAVAWFGDRVTVDTVLRYIREDGLPARKYGNIWYIDTDELMEWQMGRAA